MPQFARARSLLATAFERLKRDHPNTVGFILPFIRTPYNIASKAVDISPLGVARTAIEASTGIGRGRQNLSRRVRDNVLGVAAAYWAYDQAQQGNVTGAGPDDPEKISMLRATGWQPYSVRFRNPLSGKAEYWSYANFAPFSLALASGAAAYEAQKYAKPGATDTLNVLGDAAKRTGKVVTEMTVLAGIGALVKAQSDPARYGTQWLSQALTQLIPAGSLINTVGQSQDPLLRRSERTDPVTQVSQNLLARIAPNPVTPDRLDVPAAQDPLGRDILNEQTGFGALNPFKPTTVRDDPTMQKFLDAKVDIGSPRKEIIDLGAKVELSASEQRRWNTLRGEEIIRQTERINPKSWDVMMPERRVELLEGIRQDATELASELSTYRFQDGPMAGKPLMRLF